MRRRPDEAEAAAEDMDAEDMAGGSHLAVDMIEEVHEHELDVVEDRRLLAEGADGGTSGPGECHWT